VKAALLALAATLALGCAPNLSLRTAAPPSSTAELNWGVDTIELTQGVGLGFDAWCPWTSCDDIRATTDAPGIARVYPAHLDAGVRYRQRGVQAIALVGVQPGVTTLHVSRGSHVHDFSVKVLPAPASEAPRPVSP
jgi:hypothetical protein